MKILLLGILLICLNGFTGSTFNAITIFLSLNNYKWYHYYSVGLTIAVITLLIFLKFQGGIIKHIILEKNQYYFLPLLRGLQFAFITPIILYSLKYMPINIFTTLLMTTPFFLIIFAKFILNENLNVYKYERVLGIKEFGNLYVEGRNCEVHEDNRAKFEERFFLLFNKIIKDQTKNNKI